MATVLSDLWASPVDSPMAQLHRRATQVCKHAIQHTTRTLELKHDVEESLMRAPESCTVVPGKRVCVITWPHSTDSRAYEQE